MEDHYTVSEAARLLDLTPGRVRQLLAAGELAGSKDALSDRWRVSQAAVLERRAERKPAELPASPAPTGPDVAELIDRIARLERALGRAEERGELTEQAHSTTREQLERERERADRLESELAELRGRGFWARLFGG